jgi:hypothetical protein
VDIAELMYSPHHAVVIRMIRSETGSIAFPDFEEGSQLGKLAAKVADALSTSARKPVGSPLELLIGFEGYPDEFALWWDGFTCELGCSGACSVDLDVVTNDLVASGAFVHV